MREAKAVNAVGRFEVACCHNLCAGKACDLPLVYRTRDRIAFYRDRDLLRHGLADASGFVYCRIRISSTADRVRCSVGLNDSRNV